jgi:hypothetical protein
MPRAQEPRIVGTASHVSYVREAYRNPTGSAYLVANPLATRPAQGDLLCSVRAASRVFGFAGLATLLSGQDAGLGMHCDIVVGVNPGNDHLAYLVGGNVLDGVTMRLLPLTPGGQFADLPLRSPGEPDCSPDAPASCNANRQDWAVLLQLKPDRQLAGLMPALPVAPALAPSPAQPAQRCCVNCVVGSGVPRCPAGTPAPVAPNPVPAAPAQPAPVPCCVNCVVGSNVPRCPPGATPSVP